MITCLYYLFHMCTVKHLQPDVHDRRTCTDRTCGSHQLYKVTTVLIMFVVNTKRAIVSLQSFTVNGLPIRCFFYEFKMKKEDQMCEAKILRCKTENCVTSVYYRVICSCLEILYLIFNITSSTETPFY